LNEKKPIRVLPVDGEYSLLKREVLQESEGKYRTLFEEALDAIFLADAETGILMDCNRAAVELFGRTKTELIGKHQRILHPRQEILEEGLSQTFKQHLEEKRGQALETQVITKKGEIKEVAIKVNLIETGGKKVLLGISRDITERKKAEQALKESEEKYRILIEQSLQGIVIAQGPAFRIVFANSAMSLIFGYTPEELTSFSSRQTLNIIHPDDRELVFRQFKGLLEGKPTTSTHEVRGIRKDGTTVWIELSAAGTVYKGQPSVLATFIDMTERKKTEEQLRESEEKYRNLIDSAPGGVLVVDLNGVIKCANPAFLGLIGGHSEAEIVGKHFTELETVRKEDIPKFIDIFESIIEKKASSPMEFFYVLKDGTSRWVEVHPGLLTKDGQLTGIQVIMRDMTTRKHMERELQDYSEHLEELVKKRTRDLQVAEKRLLKVERLAAIGELAGMVGHDLRNPLMSISAAQYYLKTTSESALNEQQLEMMGIIEEDIAYCNKIVDDLQDYAREMRLEMASVMPRKLLEASLSTISLPKNIRILNKTLSKPAIQIDPLLMRRVFSNIIKNAIEAMPEGGKLTIGTNETDGAIEFTFTDTGNGISKPVLKKIGKPLFTTKARGMGFGLAICYRIVEAHKGKISIESTVGKGTTVRVTLPISQDARKDYGDQQKRDLFPMVNDEKVLNMANGASEN
jgi:PAS domain S-box-containing protein